MERTFLPLSLSQSFAVQLARFGGGRAEYLLQKDTESAFARCFCVWPAQLNPVGTEWDWSEIFQINFVVRMTWGVCHEPPLAVVYRR